MLPNKTLQRTTQPVTRFAFANLAPERLAPELKR